jgi:hypothetical protein
MELIIGKEYELLNSFPEDGWAGRVILLAFNTWGHPVIEYVDKNRKFHYPSLPFGLDVATVAKWELEEVKDV